MSVYGIESFLIGMILGGVNVSLFIYIRKRAARRYKIPLSPRFRQSAPTIEGRALNPTARRRKIESKPTVICLLPIQRIIRPEAAL